MKAGALRHRVHLLRPQETKNAHGQRVMTYAHDSVVHAAVEVLRQEERVDAERVGGKRTHRITLRYFPGLTSRWRIKLGAREFEIDGVVNVDERNIETQALCVERT
jgi:SPP1 family predicted phage head-tail adaptor